MATNYDVRKAEFDGINIDKWEPSEWQMWKPHYTGGSSTNFTAIVEREYIRIRYSVQKANEQLDLDKVRVKIKLTNPRSLGLQASFPLKPADQSKNNSLTKQYVISLGFTATDSGIKAAVAKARELDLLLMTKQFKWTDELLGKVNLSDNSDNNDEKKPKKIVSELIKDFEIEFWKTHSKDRKGLHNWNNQYWKYLKKLPQNEFLNKEALKLTLESSEPNTETRSKLVWILKKFCEFCNVDFSKFIDSYNTGTPKRKRRELPTDSEIIEGYFKINSPLSKYAKSDATTPEQWGWIYGMLATYGLRPHELWAVDIDAYVKPTNINHLVVLDSKKTDGTKTNERNCGVPPLHLEWVQLFDLKNVKLPEFNGTLVRKTQNITNKFCSLKMGFKPYDLRHCYAIRGHRLRLPIRTMADYLGHSVGEHEKSYQRWMGEDANLQIYEEVVLSKQSSNEGKLQTRITELEFANAELKVKNALLESDNESLKAQLEALQAILNKQLF